MPFARLALFAAGDFGFNLFWQSTMLYLLFFYTEALAIPAATAGTIFLVASAWDGIASFAAGVAVDRGRWAGRYGRVLAWGAVPLGISFALVYVPVRGGMLALAWALATQLLFRTAYAAINVPYTAMSARVSLASADRATVAGLRMLAGTLAAVAVAGGTVPVGRLFGGEGAAIYRDAALVFAAAGAALIALVGATFRDRAPVMSAARPPTGRTIAALARNRGYGRLMAGMAAMIVAVTLVDRSVLYYFKYVLGDEGAGRLTLATMAAVSGLAVPAWMLLARRVGTRRVWLAAVAACCAGLLLFVLVDVPRVRATQGFLIAMHAAIVGLHFSFWAMLPDTLDGEAAQGGQAVAFGLAALVQRVAIGAATALLGLGLEGAAPDTAALRATIGVVPLVFFLLAGAALVRRPR